MIGVEVHVDIYKHLFSLFVDLNASDSGQPKKSRSRLFPGFLHFDDRRPLKRPTKGSEATRNIYVMIFVDK